MQLAEAAAPLCDVIWVIDGRIPEMVSMSRLLKRFGPVVDTGGRTPEQAAEAVAQHEPAGLVTYFDARMVELAEMAAHLRLRFHRPETAAALVDKAEQRTALDRAGIAGPGWSVLPGGSAGDAIASIPESLGWPLVIKPRSESGSRHTFLARSPIEAISLVESIGPDHEELIAEQYIADDPEAPLGPYADYFSVESLVRDGQFVHVALTGRFPPAATFRETGFFIPAVLPDPAKDAAFKLAREAAEALGVTDGCLHTEIKLTPEGLRLIEVNGRLGGGIPDMLQQAAGVSLLEESMRIALGEPLSIDGPITCDRVGYRFFLQPPQITGTVSAIGGLDRLADHPGVDNLTVHRGPGSAVDWREGTRVFVLAVVGSAESQESVLEVDRILREEVSVSYESVTTSEPASRGETG